MAVTQSSDDAAVQRPSQNPGAGASYGQAATEAEERSGRRPRPRIERLRIKNIWIIAWLEIGSRERNKPGSWPATGKGSGRVQKAMAPLSRATTYSRGCIDKRNKWLEAAAL